MKVNIANIVKSTHTLGPGSRAVVWVQGCPFRCPSCIAPDWQPYEGGQQLTPAKVVQQLITDEIKGITISGGEPFSQAEALAEVVYLAQQRKPELDIICFTGYRYETLLERSPNAGAHRLISLLDVLIDGPYVPAMNDGIGLRGSSNQRIIHLTDRLKRYTLETAPRKMEMLIEDDHLTFVGIPSPMIRKALSPFMVTKGAPYERI